MQKLITKSFNILIIAIFLFFSVNTNSYGQNVTKSESSSEDINKNGITFGLAHSMHFTTITGDFPSKDFANLKSDISTSSPRFTFGIGMTIDYHFNKLFSLQLDFLYMYAGSHLIQKTTIYNEVGIIENKKYYTYAMNYFKFPLTLNLYPIPLLYVNGGGYFAPLISSSKYDHWYDNREPIEDIRPFDYGFVVGMGLNLKYVKLGFQYSYGIGSFVDSKSFDIHHNVFELTARWKFYSDIRNRSNKY